MSQRHARIVWEDTWLVVEDLASTNGTTLEGNPIVRARLRAGADLRFGSIALPWTHPEVRVFLGTRPRRDTRRMRSFAHVAKRLWPPSLISAVAAGFALLTIAAGFAMSSRHPLASAARLGETEPLPTSPEERSIRERIAPMFKAAVDGGAPPTRNLAVRLASRAAGPFHTEQMLAIWSHARSHWRYVSDPAGREYFARASETIENGLAGDCDDFAALMVAMASAIGARARMVMVDGADGGHAYAEVCIEDQPESVARAVAEFYRSSAAESVHFRADSSCPVWLNLDWNAGKPGGAYGREHWAVAIEADGRTSTLAPSRTPANETVLVGTPP